MEHLEDVYELSPMQQGMLFHTLYNPQANLYFEQTALTIRGELDGEAFAAAWAEVLARHPILRTAFYWEEMDKPLQVVHRHPQLAWQEEDWRGLAPDKAASALDAFLLADQRAGFPLDQPPLMRFALLRFADDGYYFVWSHHHLLLDGWSVPLLLDEVFSFYGALGKAGQEEEARRLAQQEIRRRRRPRPYREYILWLQQQDGAAAERYWRGLVADISAPTPFSVLEPARRSKPAGPKVRATQHFAEQRFSLSPEITGRLQALARQQRLTLNTLVQGAWSILLSRYSREERVVFGATVSGRPPELPGAEGMVGLFINTLPVCVHAPGDALLLPWLREILEAQVKREQFAHTPLVDIQGWSDLPPGSALFESILVFENYPMDGALSTQGIDISDIRTFEHTNYPLTVEALAGQPGQAQAERTLSLKLKYDAARFDAFAVENMGRHLLTLLSAMAENPERRLAELPLLDANERAGMLNRWQAVDAYRFSAPQGPTDGADPTADLPLHLLFEAQVARRPDAVAVVCDGQQLTYAELNRRANRLAHHLQSLGVGPEVLVGLCLERSLEMVVAVLAILKAGGAYLPLDTAYPQERLDFMLADAQAPVLLTQASLADKFSGYGGHRFLLDVDWPQLAGSSQENPAGGADHNHLAYVIYTSGSTGAPKGVMISHANVTRLFAATDAWYGFGVDDVWTLFHSIAFDFSVWELWGALLYGGRLVVVPYLVSRSPEAFYRLLVDEQVTVLNQTPSAFRQLMGVEASLEATLPDRIALRLVIFGGEALEIAGLRPWFQRHGDQKPRLVNMYGITETTVHVTYRPLGWADIDSPGSVIGGPIPDLQLYILDENREPTPVGVPGEMYVGGAGVSRGYLNRPELNRERFIPHPFQASDFQAEDARLYRTGDLARFLPNGDIEYLGRIDHQVKIRGFRIELGEIEHALAQHPAVQEQIVLVREDEPGHKRLVAYLVFKHGQADALPQIRDYLQQKLPEYMVPAAFVVLSALPLTPNGKTDRRALPAPDSGGGVAAVDRIAPRTPEEKALAAIWSAVLGRAPIGIYDSFFDLGGDSILSIQVLAKAKEQKLNLSLEQLFTYPTIYELAQRISPEPIPLPPSAPFSLLSQADRSQLAAEMGESIEDAYPLTRLQLGMLFHSDYTGAASGNLNGGQPGEEAQYHNVNSLHLAAPFDESSFRRALDGLMAGHPVLRTAFAIDRFSRPLQLVYSAVPAPLTIDDLRHLSPGEQEEALRAWFEQQTRALFAWDQPPLLRFHIHQRDAHSFQLSWAEHHAIVDGWSVASMITELLQRYLAERSGIPFGGQPVASSFREYVALEGATVASPQARDYWAGQLAGAEMARLPRLPHAYRSEPTSHGEPTGARAGEYDVAIGPEVSQGLKALARQAGAPLKNVLLAAHLRVLSLLCGQEDVVTGLAWNGRLEERDGERVVGLFLNTLPFRLKMGGGNWLELVQESFAGERAAIGFRRYPYAELQKTFGPLFETAFNFTHFHIYEAVADAPGMKIVDGRFFQRTNFTLLADFSLDIADGRVLLSLGYDARQLDPEQIQAIGGYYARTLAEMAAHPQGQYQEFSPLSAQERAQQLVEWNDTATDYPRTATIHRLFEEQAARTPEAVAVVLAGAGSATGGEPSLRYRELNERANQVARALQAQGAGPETLVGICVERSLEMVVGLLGILKAGAAFVPLDPAYPAERLHFMIEDTEVGILLTQERFLDQLPATATTLCLDGADPGLAGQPTANPQSGAGADSLAYVMYTSGSTGKPKGVCVTHRNVTRLVQNTNFAVLDREQVFLQLAPISFDASTLEIWGALLNGARLVVAPPATPSLEELGQILQSYGVTILWLTSGLFHLMVDERLDDLRGVKQLLAGGDVLSVPHVQKVLEALPDCTLINGYGPTENTTFTCCYPVRQMRGFDMSVPIGRPIANTQVYIVNERMQPLPVGVAGELYAGGDGVARGYHARPELSSERFLPNPFDPAAGGQLYKTGDLARYLPDGAIEFLGRLDNQVKVRGFRVELGEIESVLGQLPEVRDVVAIVREDQPGSKRIVAYLTARDPHRDDLSPERLRGFLHDRLPDFMIPGAFVTLDALPLNPNGKVDRRALPAPDWRASRPEDDYTAPRTETEERLARIWAGVLNLERVGVHDNYFALGGDSILSIQIVSRARQAGMQFSARQLFENQTVAELAAVARSLADPALAEQGPVVGDLPLTPIQRWFFEQEQPAPHHFNQAALFETPGDVSPQRLRECVGRLLAHHDALRLRFAPQPDPSGPGWRQTIVPPDDAIPFQVIDLSHLPPEEQAAALEEAASGLQASLDLAAGPIVQVALFTLGAARPARLLILVHHLAIDGISWRILGEDLESAYEQLGRGQDVQLPPKTTSYRAWAQRLHQAGGPLVMDEAPYWAAMAERRPPALPVDRAAPENRMADTAQLRVSLSAAETDALLHEAPEAYNTQINDLLLTALAQTLAPWTQSDSLYINLEGHGREELFADVDLSRTVGWFTTIFPVWLTPEQDGPGAAIKSVKEQLRQVPRRGMGYGILRYLAQGESSLPAHLSSLTPAISFNYLGQFQAPAQGALLQRLGQEESGPLYSPQGMRPHLLDIVGAVIDGQLQMEWIYNKTIHTESTIGELAHAFKRALSALIAHCQSPQAGGWTPSDFPDAELDQDELEALLSALA